MEQSKVAPEREGESRSSPEERDVSPLQSEGVTSLQRVGETPPQKVPPPKPKRPVRGWQSPLLNSGRVEEEEEGTNLARDIAAQAPATCEEQDGCRTPPPEQDCLHRTHDQMEELQGNPNQRSGVRRPALPPLPPLPPRRDDSLGRRVVEDAAVRRTEKSEHVAKHEPPVKPATLDSITSPLPPPPPEVQGSECYAEEDYDSEPLPPPPAEMVAGAFFESTPAQPQPQPPPPPPPASKPAVKPRPPRLAVKPPSKPTVPKPAPALIPKPGPPVAPKRFSPEPTRPAPPVLPKAAAKRKPSPIDIGPSQASEDSTQNHLETDMSLEDAIRTVLRSPAPHKKLMSPGRSSPQAARHKFDDIPPHERDTSEQLMDDIDEMLKDLNKELDELIPGM